MLMKTINLLMTKVLQVQVNGQHEQLTLVYKIVIATNHGLKIWINGRYVLWKTILNIIVNTVRLTRNKYPKSINNVN